MRAVKFLSAELIKVSKTRHLTVQILSADFAAASKTHTHPFNGPLSGTTRVSRYQKGKTNLDFIEARDSEWQWHQWQPAKTEEKSLLPSKNGHDLQHLTYDPTQ